MHTKLIPHIRTPTNKYINIYTFTDIFKYAYTHLHLLIYTQPFIHSQ